MTEKDYLKDPCGASSLPFWKTELITPPENVSVIKADSYSPAPGERAEPYFKLLHSLKDIPPAPLPEGFIPVPLGFSGFAEHIASCYEREGVSKEELSSYASRPVYAPELWLAVAEQNTGLIAATGIAELDPRIGEGALEWIQVSPAYRRRGLGAYLVCELLRRMRRSASFATVSGRLLSPSRPLELYLSCGFTRPVIWQVVTRE
ncbi:MAG: GNAT family N-acetyltransferase [Clostridia bacterium]|nr:GNAT family N-acetyltransferase [Clostridia bacterium]